MTKETEYFLSLYTKTQDFMDKITLTVSLGVISLSLGLAKEFQVATGLFKYIFLIGVVCAALIVFLQLIGAIMCKYVCDYTIAKKNARSFYNIQAFCNSIINLLAIIMLVAYTVLIFLIVFQ